MPTPSLHDLSYNRLLHAMPGAERRRLRPQLTWTELPLGRTLSAPSDPLSLAHFSVLDRSGIERRSCECYAAMTAICHPWMPEATLRAPGAAR